MAKASDTKDTPAPSDAERLQAVRGAIAGLWTDLQADLSAASNESVKRSEELEALLAERAELQEAVIRLREELEALPPQLNRADLAGDAEEEGRIRQRYNAAGGELDYLLGRAPEIDARLGELGYSTTAPDPERELQEAKDRIRRDTEARRQDAAFTVESQRDELVSLLSERGYEALLRISDAKARMAEQERKRANEDALRQRETEFYERRTQGAVATADRMPQHDQPEEVYGYPGLPGYAWP